MYWTTIGFAMLAAMGVAQQLPENGLGSTPQQRLVISQAQVSRLLAACVSAATSMGASENCAVTDPSGFTFGFIHMDNAYPGSIEIAQKKARTAVLFNGLNSAQIGMMAQPGQPLEEIEETNGGLIAFGGGYPIFYQGHLIGGIGASGGASVQQDEAVALAALSSSGFQTNSEM